jgi:membrane associated rhomboid family serine protease
MSVPAGPTSPPGQPTLAELARLREARQASRSPGRVAPSTSPRAAPLPNPWAPPAAAPAAAGPARASWWRGNPPPGPPPAARDPDAQLALRLQQEEYAAARRQQAAAAAAPAGGGGPDEDLAGRAFFDDPVWGRWVHPGPRGSMPHAGTMCCLSCCPCCVPPCCAPARRAACRRVAGSAAFLLSLAQLAVFAASLSLRGFAPYDVNPGLGPWSDTLDFMGAKNAVKAARGEPLGAAPAPGLAFSAPQPWRLLSCIFLHGGLLHLALNMMLQLRLGLQAEFVWGSWRFLPVYFGSGVAASLWASLLMPGNISVGASGALMGVLGAWSTFLVCHWGHGSEAEQVRRRRPLAAPRPLQRTPLATPPPPPPSPLLRARRPPAASSCA